MTAFPHGGPNVIWADSPNNPNKAWIRDYLRHFETTRPLTFFDFGAVGDGVTNDAAAVQSALRSGETIINPKQAIFLCSATVSAPDVDTFVRGGTLKFTGGTDGVQLHHTGPYTVDWDDVSILTTQEVSGNGLSITFDAATIAANRHIGLVKTGPGLEIGGVDDLTGAWVWGIYGDNICNATIRAPLIRGRKNMAAGATTHDRYYRAGTGGIYLTSTDDGSPVNCVIDAPHCRSVETGIKLLGAMEGIKILRPHIPSCRWGINADYEDIVAVTDLIDPGLWIVNGHINAAERCIIGKNLFEAFVEGNEVYRFANVDGVNWQCYEFDTVSELVIDDDRVNGFNATGTPGTVKAGTLTNTKRSQFRDLLFTKCNAGIDLTDSASKNNRFRDIEAFDGAAKDDYQVITFSGGAAADNIVSFDGGAGILGSATGVSVASGTTNIVSKSIPDAAVGEVYAVDVEFEALKGGTAGLTKIFVTQTGGTGTVTMDLGAAIDIWQGANVAAATSFRGTGRGFVTVTVAGTIQITVQGQSSGSNSTTDAAIRITRLS